MVLDIPFVVSRKYLVCTEAAMGNEVSQDDVKNMNASNPDSDNTNLYPTRPYNYAFEEGRMLDKDLNKAPVHARKSNSYLNSNQSDLKFPMTGTTSKAGVTLLSESVQLKGLNQEARSSDTLCMDAVEWKTNVISKSDGNTAGDGLKKNTGAFSANTQLNASKSKAGINKVKNGSQQKSGNTDDDWNLKKVNKVFVSKGDQENGYHNIDSTTAEGLKERSRASSASSQVNASKASINDDNEAGNGLQQKHEETDDRNLKNENVVFNNGNQENGYLDIGRKHEDACLIKDIAHDGEERWSTVVDKPPSDRATASPCGKSENLVEYRRQESAKEVFPAPQGFDELSGLDLSHLSAEERMMILQVAARAKQIERVEEQKIRKIEDQLADYSKSAQQNVTKPIPSARKPRKADSKGRDAERRSSKEKDISNVTSNDMGKTRSVENYDKCQQENASKEVRKGTTKILSNDVKQPPKPPEESDVMSCYLCGKILATDTSKRSTAKAVPGPHKQPLNYDIPLIKHENACTSKNVELDKGREKTGTQPVKCASCSQMVCSSCSVKSSLLAKGVLCALCAKQRELVARSNLWLKSPKRNQLPRSWSADTSLDLTKAPPKESSKWEKLPWHGRSYSDSGKSNFFRTSVRKNSDTSSSGKSRRNSWILSSKGGSRAVTDSSSSETVKTTTNQEKGLSIYAKKRATVCVKQNISTAIYEDKEVSPKSCAQQKEAATRREVVSEVNMLKNKSPSRPSVSSVLVKHLSDHEDVKKELKNQKEKREEMDKISSELRNDGTAVKSVGSKQGATKLRKDDLVKAKPEPEGQIEPLKLDDKYSSSALMLVSCDVGKDKLGLNNSQIKKNKVIKGGTKKKDKQSESLKTKSQAAPNDIQQVNSAQKSDAGLKTAEVDSPSGSSMKRSSVTSFKSVSLSSGTDAEVVKDLTSSLISTDASSKLPSTESGYTPRREEVTSESNLTVKQKVFKEQGHATPSAKPRLSKSTTATGNKGCGIKTEPHIEKDAKDMKKESNILSKRDEFPKTEANACRKFLFKNTEPAVLKEEELDGSDSFFLAVGNSSMAGKLSGEHPTATSPGISSVVDLHSTYGIDYSPKKIAVTSGYATEDEEFILDEKDTEGDFEHLIEAENATSLVYPTLGLKRVSRCANLSYSDDPGKGKHQDLSVKVMSQRNTSTAKVVASPETNKQKVSAAQVKRKKEKVVKDQSHSSSNLLSPVAEGPDSGLKSDYAWENYSDVEQVLNSQPTKVNEYEKNIAMMKNVLENEKTSPPNSPLQRKLATKNLLPSACTVSGHKLNLEKKEETVMHSGLPWESEDCSMEKKDPVVKKHVEIKNKTIDLRGDSEIRQGDTKFGFKTFPSLPMLSTTTTTAVTSRPASNKESLSDPLGVYTLQCTSNDMQESDSQKKFSYRYDSDEDDILKSATTSVPTFPETLMKSGLGGVLYGTDEEEDDYSMLNSSESLPKAKPKKLANMFMRRTTSTDSFEDLLRQFESTASSSSREVTGSGLGARRRSLKPDARKKNKNSSLPSVFVDSSTEDQSGDSSQSSSFSPAKEGNVHLPDKSSEDRRHSLPVPSDIVPVRTTFSDPSDLRLPNEAEQLKNSCLGSRPSILVISPDVEVQKTIVSRGTYDRAKMQSREHFAKHGTKKKMITSLSGEFASDLSKDSTSSTPSYCSSSSAAGLFVNGFARCFSCGTLSTQAITGKSPSTEIHTKILPDQELSVAKVYDWQNIRSVDSSTQVSPDTEHVLTDGFSSNGLSLADLRRIKSLIEALNDKSDLDDLPNKTALVEETKVPVTGLKKNEKIIIPSQDKHRKATIIYKDASCGSGDHQNVGPLDTVIHPRSWIPATSTDRVKCTYQVDKLKNESSSQTDSRGIEEIVQHPKDSAMLNPNFMTADSAQRVTPNLPIPSPSYPPAQPYIHDVKPSQLPPVSVQPYPANINFPSLGYNLPSFPAVHSHYQIEQQPMRYPHSITNPAQMYNMQISEYGYGDMSRIPAAAYPSYGLPYSSQFNPPLQLGTQEYRGRTGDVWHDQHTRYVDAPKPITSQPVIRGDVSQRYAEYIQPPGYHYKLHEDQRYRDYSEHERKEDLYSQCTSRSREKSRRYSGHNKPPRHRRSSKDREAELDNTSQWNMPFSSTPKAPKTIHGLRKCSSVPAVSVAQSYDQKNVVEQSSEAVRAHVPEQIPETGSEFYESETSGTEEMESYDRREGRRKYRKSVDLYSDNEDDENSFYQIKGKYARHRPNWHPSRERHQRMNYEAEYEMRTASLPRSSDRQRITSGRYFPRHDRSHRDENNYTHDPRQLYSRSSSHEIDRGMTRSLSKRSLPVPPEEDEYNWRYQNARRQAKINPAKTIANTLQRNDENVEREVTRLQQTMDDLDQEERELDLRLKYLEIGRSRRSSMTSQALHEDLRHSQNMEAMGVYGMSSARQPFVSRNMESIESFLNYLGPVISTSERTQPTSQLPTVTNALSRRQLQSGPESRMTEAKKTNKRNYETVDDVEEIRSRGFLPPSNMSDDEDSMNSGHHKRSARHTSHHSQYRQLPKQDVSYLVSSQRNKEPSNSGNAMTSSTWIGHAELQLPNGEAPRERAIIDPASHRRTADNRSHRSGDTYNAYYTTVAEYTIPAQDRFTNPNLQWFNDKIDKCPPANKYDWTGNFRLKNELEHFYSLKNNYLNNMHKLMSDRYNYEIQEKCSRKSKEHQYRTNKSSSKGEENIYAELVSRPFEITTLCHKLDKAEKTRGSECIDEVTAFKKPERRPNNQGDSEFTSRGVKLQRVEQEDDLRTVVSDSEAYHLRKEMTDWFDKPSDERISRRY